MNGEPNILAPGRNCWRRARAERAAFIIDAADYFKAFKSAASRAQRSILIAAWDIDSHTTLERKADEECLGDFLNRLASENPRLDIHILNWDFSVIYLFEREILPLFNLAWKTHPRVHFKMDAEHPIGASQHQKIVVVDDTVAFCGGIDITRNRWDTSEHSPNDRRRVNPSKRPYRPFHDAQMVVQGDAARALGDVFRDRWRRATGSRLKRAERGGSHPWPENIVPDLWDIQVGISRTLPAYKGFPEVSEIKCLYEDAVFSAQKSIYLENQYLTSRTVAGALSESLGKKAGPEIVLVLPRKSDGWLEQGTMDNLRLRILRHLESVDRWGRLRVYYPVVDSKGLSPVVHSKILIVDDRFVRVGSSNLSNRSMGLDSECDLSVEADGNPAVERAAAGLRNRLLAEHLGEAREKVNAAWDETRSLIRTIENLRGEGRTLRPLETGGDRGENDLELLEDIPFVDPERPAALEETMDHFLVEEVPSRRPKRNVLGALALLLLLGGLWRFTPLGDWLSRDRLLEGAMVLKDAMGMPLGILAAYLVGGLLVVPVTLLHALTGILFPFPAGFYYALAGSLLSAVEVYLLSFVIGRGALKRLGGRRINRISKKLAQEGWIAVLVVRNLPVAPFSIVNLLAGASRVRFRDYMIGTALGLAPGILVVTLFSERVFRLIRNPNWTNTAVAAAIAVFLGGASWWLKWRLTRNQ